MDKQFTASEVRRTAAAIEDKQMLVSSMLRAYADLLEAREKAVPVAYILANGTLAYASTSMPINNGTPLYTHPSPSDAERLAEALQEILDYRGGAANALDDEYVVDRAHHALAAHSAQAQPPAASVTEVTGLTWEPPNVTVDVERVGRFRSGDEHIVRVTFRSSDDGRRMTCFYAANESAVGYLHAMLAAQENPNG